MTKELPDTRPIGKALAEALNILGITQSECARSMSVDAMSVSRWVTNKSEPRKVYRKKIEQLIENAHQVARGELSLGDVGFDKVIGSTQVTEEDVNKLLTITKTLGGKITYSQTLEILKIILTKNSTPNSSD